MKLFSGNNKNKNNKPQARNREPTRSNYESSRYPDYTPGDMSGNQPIRPTPKKTKKKGFGFTILVIFLAIVILALTALIYWTLSTKAPDVEPPANTDVGTSYQMERYYTFMIVGDDQEGGNTDTIMIMRFDTVELSADIISIPRDTMVNSPIANKKINAVYHNSEDGMQALMDEVQGITGFRPNNYMMVDTDVFIEIVDAMGGVDFYVPFDMHYYDYSMVNGEPYEFTIDVDAGQQTLDGYDAIGVFRWRQNVDGTTEYANPDIERIAMQHNLLMAIAEKAMSTRNVFTLLEMVSAVLDRCETDLTMGNIQWYIEMFLKMNLDDINFLTAPTTGCMINRTAYVALNIDEWIQMLNESYNPTDVPITAANCAIMAYSDSEIDGRGYLLAEPEDIYCTNGEEVYDNFYENKQ